MEDGLTFRIGDERKRLTAARNFVFGEVTCVNTDSLPLLSDILARYRVRLVAFDGAQVRDKASFFRQAASDLLQPAEMPARDNWDALEDNLFGELEAGAEGRVCVLWTDAHRMLDGGLLALLQAVDIFRSVSRALGPTKGPRPLISLFLIGDGPNFPPIFLEARPDPS